MRYLPKIVLAAAVAALALLPFRGQAYAAGASCSIASEAPVLVTGTTDTLTAAMACQMRVYSASGAVTVTPPNPATTLPAGWKVWIKSQGAGGVTLATASGGALTDGAAGPVSISQHDGIGLRTDGTNYYTTGLGVAH